MVVRRAWTLSDYHHQFLLFFSFFGFTDMLDHVADVITYSSHLHMEFVRQGSSDFIIVDHSIDGH